MSTNHDRHDPRLDRAREEAAGVEVFDDTTDAPASVLREAEDAQGVESFADPDSMLPAEAITEGPPGDESLTAADVVPDWNSEDDHRETT